jgi:M6 family metalloprotease-like protein
MKCSQMFALALGLSAALSNSQVRAQSIDPTRWYRLSNLFLGDGRSLDTYGGDVNEPYMGATGDLTGQYWKLTPLGDGYYRVTNDFLGDCRALDTYADGENRPFMGQTGNYSGQSWRITSTGKDRARLSNLFLGEARSLDTYSGSTNRPFMGQTGNYSGQHWQLTALHSIPSAGIPFTLSGGEAPPYKFEGETDYVLHLRPTGNRRIAMVFVDFDDATGTQPTEEVADHLLGSGAADAWLREKSGERFGLDITRFDGYQRMPKPAGDYDYRTYESHAAFIGDAAALFDGIVDLSAYDLAMIVAAPSSAPGMALSPAFNAYPGNGVTADGMAGEVRLAVTFGVDSYTNPYINLIHELLHLHGLPDLYTSTGFEKVGAWDIMSDIFQGNGLLGWHRHKLGWLDASRTLYVASGSQQVTLSPLDGTCGTSLVLANIDDQTQPTRTLAIEIAQPFRNAGQELSPEGVLIYTVDATVATGEGPVAVHPRSPETTAHGALGAAPYGVGDTYTDGTVSVRVLDKSGPLYRVQIDIAPR